MLRPGRQGVDNRKGRVQRGAGFVGGIVRNFVHLCESLCRGGAIVKTKEVLAGQSIPLAIADGD